MTVSSQERSDGFLARKETTVSWSGRMVIESKKQILPPRGRMTTKNDKKSKSKSLGGDQVVVSRGQFVIVGWLLGVTLRFFGGFYVLSV